MGRGPQHGRAGCKDLGQGVPLVVLVREAPANARLRTQHLYTGSCKASLVEVPEVEAVLRLRHAEAMHLAVDPLALVANLWKRAWADAFGVQHQAHTMLAVVPPLPHVSTPVSEEEEAVTVLLVVRPLATVHLVRRRLRIRVCTVPVLLPANVVPVQGPLVHVPIVKAHPSMRSFRARATSGRSGQARRVQHARDGLAIHRAEQRVAFDVFRRHGGKVPKKRRPAAHRHRRHVQVRPELLFGLVRSRCQNERVHDLAVASRDVRGCDVEATAEEDQRRISEETCLVDAPQLQAVL
mmetsp:Transcript_106269/g.298923  ORF Transcript_106269/g.298923 Transcript_106269/m.298923 type:complete len:295 (+) Transcript_106269:1602-2486(+)